MANISTQTNVFNDALQQNVQKSLFLGLGCANPKLAPQPIKEENLFTGPLSSTNEN